MLQRMLLVFLFIIPLAAQAQNTNQNPGSEENKANVTQQLSPSPSTESATELPKSFGPMGQHEKRIQLVKQAFILLPSMGSVGSFTTMHIRDLKNIAHLYATVEPKCNLERIKSIVASGMAPVVAIRSLIGRKRARVIIGYDDSINQLIATDPIHYKLIKISYDNFAKTWTDSQKTCLLIYWQYDNKQQGKYLKNKNLHKHKSRRVYIQ